MEIEKKYKTIQMLLKRHNFESELEGDIFKLGSAKVNFFSSTRRVIILIAQLIGALIIILMGNVVTGFVAVGFILVINHMYNNQLDKKMTLSENNYLFSSNGIGVYYKEGHEMGIKIQDVKEILLDVSKKDVPFSESNDKEAKNIIHTGTLSLLYNENGMSKKLEVLHILGSNEQYLNDDLRKLSDFINSILKFKN